MTESNRILTGAAIGAVVGGATAYLLFTSRGRRMLAQVNPTLEEFSNGLHEVRCAIRKAREVANEARCVVEDLRALSRSDDEVKV